MADEICIFEMAPRDGLQNEPEHVATVDKIRLVDLLTDAGFQKIEVTSFVSPKWVPQMADATEVMAGIARRDGIAYTALTPNMRGYFAAKAAGASEVAVFASASEGFSRANINCSVADSVDRFKPILEAAKQDGMPVRGYISCIAVCPFDGAVPPAAVADLTEQLLTLGCYEISLGDTVGRATTEQARSVLDAVLAIAPASAIAGHFHDTHGGAVDNIAVCLERGLRTFDAAVGGLGGCPYAPGAPGNVATERVVGFANAHGLSTGIHDDALSTAVAFAQSLKNRSVNAPND